MAQSIALTKLKPHVIVATPGRMLHHIEHTKGFSMQKLKYLILDEADRLLDMNFQDALDKILDHINKVRVNFMYSATMTNKVGKLQRACLRDPVKIEISKIRHQTVENLIQKYKFVPHSYKNTYLVRILNDNLKKPTLIFAQTCKQTILLTLMLRNLGFDVIPINGKMS